MTRFNKKTTLLTAALAFAFAAFALAEPPPEDADQPGDKKPLQGPKRPGNKAKRPDRNRPNDPDRDNPDGEPRGPRPPRGERRPHRGPGEMEDGDRPMPPGGPDDGFGGPPRGPGPGRGEGMPPRRLSPEQIEEIMNVLRENFPTMYERLDKVRQDRPEDFERTLHRFAPFAMQVLHADPQMKRLLVQDWKMEQEIRDLERSYRSADDGTTKQKIKQQLKKTLDRQFDVRLEKHRLMIEGLERRLKESRETLAQRTARKQELVDRRLSELTERDDSMQWPE